MVLQAYMMRIEGNELHALQHAGPESAAGWQRPPR